MGQRPFSGSFFCLLTGAVAPFGCGASPLYAFMREMNINFSVKLPVLVKKKKDSYIVSCPVLDVISQGKTEFKALRNIKDALQLFLISCFERGTLDQVLRECGFKPLRYTPKKTKPLPKRFKSVNVPLPFNVPLRESVRCHA